MSARPGENSIKCFIVGSMNFGATFHAVPAQVTIGGTNCWACTGGLAAGGPQTPAELAKRTSATERTPFFRSLFSLIDFLFFCSKIHTGQCPPAGRLGLRF